MQFTSFYLTITLKYMYMLPTYVITQETVP